MSSGSGLCSPAFPSCLESHLSPKLLGILQTWCNFSSLFAPAAFIPEISCSIHLTCKAQLRCLITHPTCLPGRVGSHSHSLIALITLCDVSLPSSPPVGELFKSRGVSGCLYLWHVSVYFLSPSALQPHSGHSA